MHDALIGWSRAALARATSKVIATISGGHGPKIVARDFRVWTLNDDRSLGLIDFELTIALPGGAERTFWGYNRTSCFDLARTVEEVGVLLARDVLETLDAAPRLAAVMAAVTAMVEKTFDDLGHTDLGVELITVRPMTLPMENVCPPETVTVVALMHDPKFRLVSTEFDVECASEARRLLQNFLPKARERAVRAKALPHAA